MQKIKTLLLLILVSNFCFSQTIEIIKKSENKILVKGNDFAFLEKNTDTNKLEFVATIKSTGINSKTNLSSLYFAILEKAKAIGANCFKLNSFSLNDSSKIYSLTLDTYFGVDSLLDQNFDNHEKNMFFIFGDEKINGSDTYTFKIDGEKKKIKSGTYYKQELKEGKEVKINKGGISGMSIWLNWKPKRQSAFFNFTGFGLGGGSVPVGVVGASFNTGRITNIDGNLGSLLTQILKISE